MNVGTFFVQQEGRHFNWQLHLDDRTVVFHGIFLRDAQYVQGGGFNATDVTGTIASWAWDVIGFT